MNRFFIPIMLFPTFAYALATDPVKIADKKEIYQQFNTIPGVASRISRAGMQLEYLFIQQIKTKSDIGSELEKIGDIKYHFVSTDPSKIFISNVCRVIGGNPTFVKRNGKFIPTSKLSVWLMTGKCKTLDDPYLQ